VEGEEEEDKHVAMCNPRKTNASKLPERKTKTEIETTSIRPFERELL